MNKPVPPLIEGPVSPRLGKGVNLYRKICQVEAFVARMTIDDY